MSGGRRYAKFVAMIGVSVIVMYGVMYLNTYDVAHARWSEMRAYMTLLMGATMALVMLAFMHRMYPSARAKAAIVASSVALFAGSLWLARSQATVGDVSYMSSMIPHHSIAILTSGRADLEDARVQALADEIVRVQRVEIRQMEWLIEDIRANGPARTEGQAAARHVPEFEADSRVE